MKCTFSRFGGFILAVLLCMPVFAQAVSTSVRAVTFNNSESPDVSITVNPDSSVGVYAVEESLPAGLTPVNINQSGSWDSANRKVKWGPFFDNNPRTLSYEITGADGVYSLSGLASFDGMSVPTTGSNSVQLESPLAVVATPVFNPNGGSFSATVNVTITSATPDSTIHYTIDGSSPDSTDPSVSSGGSVPVASSLTLRAIAVKAGMSNSSVASAAFTISSGVSTSVRTISSNGSDSPDISVSVSPLGSVANYAVEEILPIGLTPANVNQGGVWDSVNRKLRWGPFFDNTPRTFSYEVVGSSGSYTISGLVSFDGTSVPTTGHNIAQVLGGTAVVATPAFSPNGGTFGSPVNVTITSSTPSSTIYYTLDGSTPNTTDPSIPSGGSVLVGTSLSLRAIAVKAGMSNSSVALANFTISSANSSSVRTISNNNTDSPDVSIAVYPAGSVANYAVEESLPAGLTPVNISNGGVWETANRKIKWGPFFDNTPRTFSYSVTGPAGSYTISGLASFDGSSVNTTGHNSAQVAGTVFLAGTELRISIDGDDAVLSWDSQPGYTYSVELTVSLEMPFFPYEGAIAATPPENVYRFDMTDVTVVFFRVGIYP